MTGRMQKRNYFEINSTVGFKNPLDSLQIFRIIEAGITFFLYQRGQIPLPFERLQLCDNGHNNGTTDEIKTDAGKTLQQGQKSEFAELLEMKNVQTDTEIPKDLDKRERLRFVIKQKKLLQHQKKDIHSKMEMLKRESYAKRTVGVALERLRSVFVNCEERKLDDLGIEAIILIFGPSINSPKEIIRFEIAEVVGSSSPNHTKIFPVSSLENGEQLSSHIRNFYKSLILSPDFMDFTSKSLTTTYTHICLETKAELINKNVELIRLENIISNSWINMRPNKKLLRIKLTRPCGSCLKEDKRNSTDANNDNYLFDKNSLCFYQIPLRFKGVKCKSKPVI